MLNPRLSMSMTQFTHTIFYSYVLDIKWVTTSRHLKEHQAYRKRHTMRFCCYHHYYGIILIDISVIIVTKIAILPAYNSMFLVGSYKIHSLGDVKIQNSRYRGQTGWDSHDWIIIAGQMDRFFLLQSFRKQGVRDSQRQRVERQVIKALDSNLNTPGYGQYFFCGRDFTFQE